MQKLVSNINEFIRCFHKFVSLFFSMNLSQFEQLKKEKKFHIKWSKTGVFSLPVEKEIITNIR